MEIVWWMEHNLRACDKTIYDLGVRVVSLTECDGCKVHDVLFNYKDRPVSLMTKKTAHGNDKRFCFFPNTNLNLNSIGITKIAGSMSLINEVNDDVYSLFFDNLTTF